MSAAAGKTRQQPTVTVNPRTFLGPQTAPGESGNRAANAFSGITMTEVCDWGTGRLVAYAHFTLVVVADPGSAQVVTTLDHHTADVTCIRFLDPLRSGDRVLLASGDTTGNLVVWDVSAGTPIVVTSCVAPTDAQRFPDLCKIVAMRQIRVP
ncbi:WD domain, partial [Diplonema papillatum]